MLPTDHNGTILGICGTHADGSWVGMITRKLGPYGEGDDLKSVGYVDDRSNGSPRLYCGCLMYGKHGHPGPSFDEFETCTLCYCEEKMVITSRRYYLSYNIALWSSSSLL